MTELRVECSSCGAGLTVEAHLKTANCPYCDSPSVVERPATYDRPPPAFVVGFVLDQEAAAERVTDWIGSRGLFAHSGLKRASVETVRGVYLPAYLYGAVGDTTYSAQIGENYTVTETYTTTDSEGRTQIRTRTRVETEWRHLVGNHSAYVSDVVVTASRGISNAELEAIEPFDLRALKRYEPGLVAGWIAEEPSRSPEECERLAHDESLEQVGAALARFMPGDSYTDLRWETTLSQQVIDLVLLPVWVFAARYHPKRPPMRILVNGQTGEVQGQVPRSWIKILLAILVVVALVAGAVLGALHASGEL